MIPHKDLEQLTQYYKGELTENALLNKAATLAAKKHVLLANPQLPPALVNAQTKPLSQELTKLTKGIRQFPRGVGVGAPGGLPGEERRRRQRGFGDGTRGTMVEAHDKRQPVHPETSHYASDPERQNHEQNCQEREPIHQSRRRYQSSFRSHSRTAQDFGKKVSREFLGQRQRQRQSTRA